MTDYRIKEHPMEAIPPEPTLAFTWQGRRLEAREGETLSSALFANGIRIFGHHPKDGAPLGIFCANGQCAQCSVIADGLPVKSCMVPVREGMVVEPMEGKPALPAVGERRPAVPGHRDPRRGVPHPRRRPGRAFGRHRAGQGRGGRHPGGRQGQPGWQAGPPDPQVLRVHRRLPRRHARHGHRQAPGEGGARLRERPGVG